jgi:ABC-2 type transport system permease protein
MINSFRAEWVKLKRPAVILGAGGALLALACLATVLTFVAADEDIGAPPLNNAPLLSTTSELATPEGISRGFIIGAGFIGVLVMVLFAAGVAGEFSQGTLHTLLTRQPQRSPLLLGKLAALLVASAIAVAVALAGSIVLAFPLAHARGISTSTWLTADGFAEIGRAYGDTLLMVVLFAILGTALGLIVRSTVPAVAIGVAWLMPFEHIVQGAWADAGRWFPGLILDAISRDGTEIASFTRSVSLGLLYTGALAAAAAVSFLRRDVTT